MELAMKEADVLPTQIDYINAHGTGTHHNDLYETRAIKLALGEDAYHTVINSTKSMIGHLLGAAGGVEFVVCGALAVRLFDEGPRGVFFCIAHAGDALDAQLHRGVDEH